MCGIGYLSDSGRIAPSAAARNERPLSPANMRDSGAKHTTKRSPRERPPRRARYACLLPPEGAFPLGAARRGKGPHAAHATRACCPRGGFSPWGGPAGKRPPRRARYACLLPPRGLFPLGAARRGKGPHAAHATHACCPPRGLFPLGAARRGKGLHAAHATRACCPPRGLFPLGAARRGKGPHAAHATRACCPPRGLFPLGAARRGKPVLLTPSRVIPTRCPATSSTRTRSSTRRWHKPRGPCGGTPG